MKLMVYGPNFFVQRDDTIQTTAVFFRENLLTEVCFSTILAKQIQESSPTPNNQHIFIFPWISFRPKHTRPHTIPSFTPSLHRICSSIDCLAYHWIVVPPRWVDRYVSEDRRRDHDLEPAASVTVWMLGTSR